MPLLRGCREPLLRGLGTLVTIMEPTLGDARTRTVADTAPTRPHATPGTPRRGAAAAAVGRS